VYNSPTIRTLRIHLFYPALVSGGCRSILKDDLAFHSGRQQRKRLPCFKQIEFMGDQWIDFLLSKKSKDFGQILAERFGILPV
jgi:hypothetical protein